MVTNQSVFSQTIYGLKKTINGSTSIPFDVVSIDPFTGNTSVLMSTNSLIGVAAGATAYDQQNKRYICWGFDNANNQQLYVMDIDNNTAVNQPLNVVQPIEMEYDLQTQKTYGLWYSNNIQHFGEIDLTTGSGISIATLPTIDGISIGNSTFDANLGRYIFIGVQSGNFKLFTLDAATGTILSSALLYNNNERFSALEFNINDNKLYGLYQDIDSTNYSPMYASYYTDLKLAEIDLATAAVTPISQNSVVSGYLTGYFVGGLCFDQLSETYIITVINENGSYLKMVDVNTGNIISATAFNNIDFYEIQCDNFSFARVFYNLNASSVATNLRKTDVKMYPNPSNNFLTIESSETIESVSIYNIDGKIALSNFLTNGQQINIQNLSSGNYFIIAKTDNGFIRQPFVKQ